MCKDTPVFLHWLIAVSSNTSWEKKNVFTVFSKHSLISPSELPCKQRIKPSKFRLSLIESTQGSNFLNCWWRVNTKHKHACLSVVLLMRSGYTNIWSELYCCRITKSACYPSLKSVNGLQLYILLPRVIPIRKWLWIHHWEEPASLYE